MSSFLDATLVIQLVHFGCAYWILSHFFLRPAYAHIMGKETEKKRLVALVHKDKQELLAQRRIKMAELTQIQKMLVSAFPVSNLASSTEATLTDKPGTAFSDESKKVIIQQVIISLNQRVRDE
jgi:hypothetical protein